MTEHDEMTGNAAKSTRSRKRDDEGSILILTLGYAVLAIVLILVCVDATSLYIAQKRLDAVADAAAIAAADGFTLTVRDGAAIAELSSEAVLAEAQVQVDAVGQGANVVEASSPDGISARVTVAQTWRPPVMTLFVPDGLGLESTATSRTALR
ncbi:pilus assembly protein TadG-related protein [Microbacterium marmarense]|uniref:Pilus assembly protein TadG-related protein n=1 Tax=Microbacterium marmarense TaxID=3122051 RepID=A0ABU8LU42_9MICO